MLTSEKIKLSECTTFCRLFIPPKLSTYILHANKYLSTHCGPSRMCKMKRRSPCKKPNELRRAT